MSLLAGRDLTGLSRSDREEPVRPGEGLDGEAPDTAPAATAKGGEIDVNAEVISILNARPQGASASADADLGQDVPPASTTEVGASSTVGMSSHDAPVTETHADGDGTDKTPEDEEERRLFEGLHEEQVETLKLLPAENREATANEMRAQNEKAKKQGGDPADEKTDEQKANESQQARPRNKAGISDLVAAVTSAPLVGLAYGSSKIYDQVKINRERLQARTFESRKKEYERGVAALEAAGPRLDEAVNAFNQAFLNTSQWEALQRLAGSYSPPLSPHELLLKISNGTAPADAIAVARDALSDPTVIEALNRIDRTVDGIGKVSKDINRVGNLIESSPLADQFDFGANAQKVENALQAIHSTQKPIVKRPEDKDLSEDIKEAMKEVQAMTQRILEAIQKFLRRGA